MIGFIGAAGCGKDTAGNYIAKKYNAIVYSSAASIKEVFSDYYSVDQSPQWKDWACHTHAGKAARHPYLDATNREVLEFLGDAMNKVDPLVLVRDMPRLAAETKQCVIDTSTREVDQAKFIKEHGGLIILIRRTANEEAAGDHHTAQFWRTYNADYIIDNNTSLEDFYSRIDKTIRLIAAQTGASKVAS